MKVVRENYHPIGGRKLFWAYLGRKYVHVYSYMGAHVRVPKEEFYKKEKQEWSLEDFISVYC